MSVGVIESLVLVCDRCRNLCGDEKHGEGLMSWNDYDVSPDQFDYPDELGWLLDHNGSDYCHDCWTWDDDGEQVVKP